MSLREALSSEDLMVTMNRLNQMIETEKKERTALEKNLQSSEEGTATLRSGENYLQEPNLLVSIREMAKEISELVIQRENLGAKKVARKLILPPPREVPEVNLNNLLPEIEEFSDEPIQYNQNAFKYENSEFVARIYQKERDKKNKIQLNMDRQMARETQEMQSKPKISETSRFLGAMRNGNIPLFQRYEQELAKRNQKLNQLKKEVHENREKEERDLTPSFLGKKEQRKIVSARSASEFKTRSNNWENKKNENILKMKYEILTEEMKALTFKPEINQKSRAMMEYKMIEEECYPDASERLYKVAGQKEKERKKKEKENIHPFRPNLNPKSQKIAEEKKDQRRKLTETTSEMNRGSRNNREHQSDSERVLLSIDHQHGLAQREGTERKGENGMSSEREKPLFSQTVSNFQSKVSSSVNREPQKNLSATGEISSINLPSGHRASEESAASAIIQKQQKNGQVLFVNQLKYSPELDFLLGKLNKNN